MRLDLQSKSQIFDYERWKEKLPELSQRYQEASPYPHIVLDNFLTSEAANQALQAFPKLVSKDWIHYVHVNEKKFGQNKIETLKPGLQQILKELNSKEFVQFLAQLTGISQLFSDDTFEGGGIHQSGPGGFLNIHADFTVHPHHRKWQRRVNLLVYLNQDWQEAYGGHLELWDQKMKACEHRVLPLFNRAVIFNTDPDSFHGHPEPLTCPRGQSRKSLALYYFTEEENPLVQSTEYRARPGDGLKSVLIGLDKWALRFYDAIKRVIRYDDDFASNLLRKVHERKQRKEILKRAKKIKKR